MRKKQQIITIHKNLQGGKANAQQQKNQPQNNLFTRGMINDKLTQRTNKKMFSQQKILINNKNRSSSRSQNNKQSRQVNSSLGKNERKKSKKKLSQPQSVKGSKKSIKRISLGEQQNLLASGRGRKNIYTDSNNGFSNNKNNKNNNNNNEQKQKKQKQNKQQRSTNNNNNNNNNRQSSQSNNEDNSFSQSIAQSMRSQSQRLDVDILVNEIKQSQFSNLHKLKLHCLNFIFRNRIIKDQQYDRLYQLMVQKFPDREEVFRSILFEILSSLDN